MRNSTVSDIVLMFGKIFVQVSVERGERTAPELMEVDALAQEIEKSEALGTIPEYYLAAENDWRKDLSEADDMYVQDPSKLSNYLNVFRIRMMPVEKKHTLLIQKAQEMIHDEITAIPTLVSNSLSHSYTRCKGQSKG